ncbi:MAG: hypothetical protein ABIJ08_02945 [Nanoarchaeota archaeon]
MKKIMIIGLILIFVLAVGVNAAAQISITSGTFGSESQRRSNSNADDDKNQVYNTTLQIKITNTGNESVSGLDLVSTTIPSQYNFVVESITPTTLIPGQEAVVNLRATVPEDFDAVNDNLVPVAFDIGTATFKTNVTGVTATSSLKMQAENNIEIKDVEVYINDKKDSTVNKDDESVDNIKPGDQVEFRITIENKYKSSDPEDLDIEDVEVSILNDDLDIDDSDDISSIGPNDEEVITLSFDIDEEQDRGSYEVLLTVDGQDENSARHGESWIINLKIERESHDIQLRTLRLDPETIDNCIDRNVELTVDIRNIGRNDEEKAAIKVSNSNIQYSKKVSEIDINQDDEDTKVFTIPVSKDTPAGEYFIEATAYYDTDKTTDIQDIKLIVNQCKTQTTTNNQQDTQDKEDEAQDDSDVIVINSGKDTNTEDIQPIIAGDNAVATVEQGFTGSTMYMVILVVAIIIAVASLVLTLVLLTKKNRSE